MGLSDTGFGTAYELQRASRHRDEDSREIATLSSRLRHSRSEARKWRRKYEEMQRKYEEEHRERLALIELSQQAPITPYAFEV